jgi:hypothetical protein
VITAPTRRPNPRERGRQVRLRLGGRDWRYAVTNRFREENGQ